MVEQQDVVNINIASVIRQIKNNKRVYIIVFVVVGIITSLHIVNVPRTYTTDTKLAPELNVGMKNGGGLADIASSFGIDLTNGQFSDAITPLLYPSLMEDNKFIASLFGIRVTPIKLHKPVTYFDYLSHDQEKPWYIKLFGEKKEKDVLHVSNDQYKLFYPYLFTKEQDKVAKMIQDNIILAVDSKNSVITITVTDQDPLVSKQVADSVRNKLQEYITHYRTNKAKRDLAYYKKLMLDAKRTYEKARRKYSAFSDANTEVLLTSVISQQEDLENDMQLKFNAYTALVSQYNGAQAKVQENTPAFTVLKGAAVPDKPTAPKRMIFVLVMEVLAFFITTIVVGRKKIAKIFN